MEDLIEIDGRYYVPLSSLGDDRARVLKHGDSFAVFDRKGDIRYGGSQGLFFAGTRYLSRFELVIEGEWPVMLNSTVKNDSTLLTADLTNPDLPRQEGDLKQGTVHLFRAKILWQNVLYEHLRLVNYSDSRVALSLAFEFAADYADLFEVRGESREQRGRLLPAELKDGCLSLAYEGLDGVERRTRMTFSQTPEGLSAEKARFDLKLPPAEAHDLYVYVSYGEEQTLAEPVPYLDVLQDSAEVLRQEWSRDCVVTTSNEQFNEWIRRAQADLHILMTNTEHGRYPYAGIPWFSTPFGRDGVITALEYLWINPDLARGVLQYLAATQAKEVQVDQEAEPGKIFHETRKGEMAALGEIPFGMYYGTVDATPLFVILAGEYYEITGDVALIENLWPHIESALHWMDAYGDMDADGFVEYERHNPRGLVQQGWKDSDDSVFHADGELAFGHIALCEVQGYVYAAKLAAAKLARLLGKPGLPEDLLAQAEQLKRRFNQVFWCEEISTFALALDGKKQPCRVRTSNPGHVLWSGIAAPDYVDRIVETLLAPESFSGWGIRTVATSEARYNPMAYHNGTVWPHDNALIALGMGRCGHQSGALRVLDGLFHACLHMDLHRLPELFCGFERRSGEGPTLYPTSCIPQAWASAAVFSLLQACLGMTFSSTAPHIRFEHPRLPDYLNEMEIRNLRVCGGTVDLLLRRHREQVGVNVLRKEGDLRIAVMV